MLVLTDTLAQRSIESMLIIASGCRQQHVWITVLHEIRSTSVPLRHGRADGCLVRKAVVQAGVQEQHLRHCKKVMTVAVLPRPWSSASTAFMP